MIWRSHWYEVTQHHRKHNTNDPHCEARLRHPNRLGITFEHTSRRNARIAVTASLCRNAVRLVHSVVIGDAYGTGIRLGIAHPQNTKQGRPVYW